MADIIEEFKSLEELVIRCMKCGTCQAYCPLYQKDFEEPAVARGKIALIEAIYEDRFTEADRILKHLDYCLLCGRCKANCPSGVITDEIFIRAKGLLRKIKDLSPVGKFILHIAMNKPKVFTKFAPFLHILLKIGSKKVKDDIVRPYFIDRNVKLFAKKTFISEKSGIYVAKKEKTSVFFYPGCATNYIFPEWGDAIIEVLTANGVTVIVPSVNTCCGMPLASLGKIDDYKKLSTQNLLEIDSSKADYVITTCPTCQYALEDLGSKLTGVKVNKKFFDILVFMDEVLDIKGKFLVKDKVSFHTPCHYRADKKIRVVEYLKRNLQGTYVPLENDSCCGFGGTFNIKKYKDSKEVGRNKAIEICTKGVKTVFTACPGCAMQLSDLLAETDVAVEHPIMHIAKTIKK